MLWLKTWFSPGFFIKRNSNNIDQTSCHSQPRGTNSKGTKYGRLCAYFTVLKTRTSFSQARMILIDLAALWEGTGTPTSTFSWSSQSVGSIAMSCEFVLAWRLALVTERQSKEQSYVMIRAARGFLVSALAVRENLDHYGVILNKQRLHTERWCSACCRTWTVILHPTITIWWTPRNATEPVKTPAACTLKANAGERLTVTSSSAATWQWIHNTTVSHTL